MKVPSPEMVRLVFTYSIAFIVVGGGMLQIYWLLSAGIISGDAGLAILGPLIGAAVAFVFQESSNAAGARRSERAAKQGAEMAATQATVTS